MSKQHYYEVNEDAHNYSADYDSKDGLVNLFQIDSGKALEIKPDELDVVINLLAKMKEQIDA